MDAPKMATPGKNPAPLLEVIRGAGRGKLTLPGWAKRDGDAPTSSAPPTAAPSPAAESPKTVSASRMQRPLTLRVTPITLAAGLVAVAVLVVGAGWVGERLGYRAGLGVQKSQDAAADELSSLKSKPPTPLIPATVEGVGVASSNPAGPLPAGPAPATVAPVAAPGDDRTGNPDPRRPGLNYFRLTSIPAGSEREAERVVAFLSAAGVDAAIIPIQNGRSLKVVALPGYARPISDPQARAFEQKLKTLGRQWHAQHHGSSDWKDMFPEKYLPGRN